MIAWFLGTRIGRTVATGFAIAAAIGLALLKAFMAGRASERAAQDRASLQNLRNRNSKNEEINNLPDSDVDERLGRWLSDDER